MSADVTAIPMPDRLLTRAMLLEIIPVSGMSMWRWMRKGMFPLPIKFNGRNYWRASEVQAWIEAQAAARTDRRTI